MQKLPTIEISDFYIEFIGYALSILVMLWIKDAIGSFLEGMKFRNNKHFKEGEIVDPDLHADTAKERAEKLQRILEENS